MVQGVTVRRCGQPVALLLALLAGCQTDGWGNKDVPPEPVPRPRSTQGSDSILVGTIGEQTLLTDVGEQPLRGFGVVVGLNGKGSRDCPTVIREYLIDFLAKQVGPQGPGRRRTRLTPAQLIDSADTAVVEVIGVVPAGARTGTRFDLRVQVIPGTSAESLAGGLLLPTQMRFFDRAASGQGMLAGSVLAEGDGPVFTSPFAESSTGTSDADPRRGHVLGGGRAIVPRPAKLTLLQPNYATARIIERRINERFGQEPKSAGAVSRGYVVLDTPPAYAQQPDLFRRLVAHLYLQNDPATSDRKLRELDRLAATGDGGERIALAWEGMGRSVIPHVQAHYTATDPAVRYYAARAGLRLGDPVALPVLADIAATGTHSWRLLAIHELGMCNSPQAATSLAPLINDPDQEVRIAAYEALLQHGHPVINATRFAHIRDHSQLNFSLDVVDSGGPPLIYVRRTRLPRIVVFGRRMPLVPPIFYTLEEDALTIHTTADSDDVRLFAKSGNRLSDEIVVPPRVADLITALAQLPVKEDDGPLRGLGLPYSRVVQVLAELCRDGTIAAPLVLEQTSLTELLGPETSPERPEGESRRESESPSDTPAGSEPEPEAPPEPEAAPERQES